MLFTRMSICHQAVLIWYGHKLEIGFKSGVALVMRHRKWSYFHPRAHSLRKGDEQPAYTLLRSTGILYFMDPAKTSCARGDTICFRPLQVANIFAFICKVAPDPACWLFKTSATSWFSTFWPWKWHPSRMWRGLPLCRYRKFSLPRPLCSRVRPDVRDRQTSDVRQTSDKSIT